MKRLISVLVAGMFAATAGFSQMNLQEAAQVNLIRTEPITVRHVRLEAARLIWGQLMQQLRRQPAAEEIDRELAAMTKEDKLQVLNRMINDKLAIQAAERDKITVTDNEINAQIERLRDNMRRSIGRNPTDAEFADAVRGETGQDVPAFREEIKKQMVLQKYINFKYENQFKNLNVTDGEIRNEYSLRRSQLVRPDTVRVSMIQVPFTANDTASKVKAKELAERLVREIGSNPAKFDETAAKGAAPNSGYQAGDAGYLPRNPQSLQMVGEEFLNTAFSLKQGEISKLIENERGYHIIKVTETYEQKNLELDDIYQLVPRDPLTVREYIRRGLLQKKEIELLEKVTQELVVELRKGNNPNNPPYKIFENNLNW
jgi:parvulin-like peptidyl-prolyl isomerase